jgi:Asp-tRNA(Asn)/Glu-tRNA(Gln) amidotransferase A subunit family amidase
MQKYAVLTKQTVRPERLVRDISIALNASPRIEVDRIQWDITANPRAATADRSSNQAAAPAPSQGQQTSGQLYEAAQIEGKVLAAKASDYKGISALMNEFVERLRKQGIEVVETKLPFEFGSLVPLKGEIGAEKNAEVPRFTLKVARKVGT